MTQPILATPPSLSHRRALLLITLVALPILLIHLGTGDPVDMMELFNLNPVREAFRDGHWLMPTLNGEPRLEKPPLPVWIPAALASLFHSENLWLLRLPSLLMALLTSFATYGIGCLLFKNPADTPPTRHRQTALLAALLLPTMLMFNREARLATYDIYATAFLTCGTFFLIKLAEPDDSPRGKKSWLLALAAGVSLGLSVLSKGPVPAATVMLPLGLWLLIYHRRLKLFALIALTAFFSILTFMPWLIAIGGLPGFIPARFPEAWPKWLSEFKQFGTGEAAQITAGTKAQLTEPKTYYLQMFIWVIPLLPTFIAALLLPFLKSQSDPQPAPSERRGRILLWLILILGLLMLTIPSEKKPRYALQLFPYAALLCAAVWQEFQRFPTQKPLDLPAKILLAAQSLFFLVPGVSIIAAALIVLATGSFPKYDIVTRLFQSAGIAFAIPLGIALTLAGIILWKNCARRDFQRALNSLALAATVFIFTIQFLYKSLPETHTNPVRESLSAAMVVASGHDAQRLPPNTFTLPGSQPWLSSLYYADQALPFLTADQFIDRANKQPTETLYFLLVTGLHDNKLSTTLPSQEVQSRLTEIESNTGRRFEVISKWLDEDRETSLLRLPARPAP